MKRRCPGFARSGRARAAPGAKRGEGGGGGPSCQRRGLHRWWAARGPRFWAGPAWPSGSTASNSTRGEKGLMLSLNSTKVQSYNIWDFSNNANFYRFFFSFFFLFCFPLIFLLLYRYFKLLLFKILYNYYAFKRGGKVRSIYRLFTTIILPCQPPLFPSFSHTSQLTSFCILLLSPNIHRFVHLNSSIQTYNTENHRKES